MTNQSQYHTEWAKAGSIPFENWHKVMMPSLISPIQYSIGSSAQGNQVKARNKETQQSHYWVYTQRIINPSTIKTHGHICLLQHCSQQQRFGTNQNAHQ